MEVFCCCGRRYSSARGKTKAPLSRPGAVVPNSLPTLPAPAVLATPTSMGLFRPLPPQLPPPFQVSSLSNSAMLLTSPIPNATPILESLEIGDLVSDDSDSGGEVSSSLHRRVSKKKQRSSGALDFVKARFRRRVSHDSLLRQSRLNASSSEISLARRAELRRLMHKRIREELRSGDCQDFQSDGPSMARSSLPGAERPPRGGGPRDHIEFSVVDATEIPQVPEPRSLSSPRSARGGAHYGLDALRNDEVDSGRRASCPDLGPGMLPHSRIREKRYSLPHLPSGLTLLSAAKSSLISLKGSSSPGNRRGSTSTTGRQAVTATVVNGGFTTLRLTGHCPSSTSHKPFPSIPVSSISKPDFAQCSDPDDSPLNIWLRSQVLCGKAGSIVSGTENNVGAGIGYDGASIFERPTTPENPLQGVTAPQSEPTTDLAAMDRNNLAPGSHDHNATGSDLRRSSDASAPYLRGGVLGEKGESSRMGSTASRRQGPIYRNPSPRKDATFLASFFSRKPLSHVSTPATPKRRFDCPKQTGCQQHQEITAHLAVPRLPTEATKDEATDNHTPKSTRSSYRTARLSTSTSSLPNPPIHNLQSDAPSAAASDASSLRRREAELQTIPTRFGESPGRRKPSLLGVSRFREELRDEDQSAPARKASALSKFHLAIPTKAQLASRDREGDDGASIGRPSFQWSLYSSIRSGAASQHSHRSPTYLDIPPSDRHHSSSNRESAEDVWRRAIKAEVAERSSIARSSMAHTSLARKLSTRISHWTGSTGDSFIASNFRQPSRQSPGASFHRKSIVSDDQSQISPMCTSTAIKQYKDLPVQDLEQSIKASETWSHPHQISSTAPPRPSNAFTPLRRISEIPHSWARFPSHTRAERNGPAGQEDKVATRDFAATTLSTEGKSGWATDQINSCPSRQTPGLSRATSKKWSRAFKTSLRKLIPTGTSRAPEKSASAKGARRSSCQTGGYLEYPELEILPTNAGLKELRALEWEIGAFRASPDFTRRPSFLGPNDENERPFSEPLMKPLCHGALVSGTKSNGRPESSGASEKGRLSEQLREAKEPVTPSPHRTPSKLDAPGTAESPSATTTSEHFVTPLSALSSHDHITPGRGMPGDCAADSGSEKSISTVINNSRFGKEGDNVRPGAAGQSSLWTGVPWWQPPAHSAGIKIDSGNEKSASLDCDRDTFQPQRSQIPLDT